MPGSRTSARLLLVATILGAGTMPAGAQGPPVVQREGAPAQGAIAGVVRDEAGAPVADARVTIEGAARLARTDAGGRFELGGIAPGFRELVVRKLGYVAARAAVPVRADSILNVAITLVTAPQQLPGVVVEAAIFNQVGGVVIDEQDRPVPGVVVEVIGLDRRFQTRADGRFLLVDLDPGHYLLQFRKPGYTVAQYGLQMARELERDFSVRLRPAGDSRLTPELAAVVAQEANRRQGMAGARAAVISRAELERFGEAPLAAALLESPAAITFRETGSSCVLINGFELLTLATSGSRAPVSVGRRGPTSITGGGGGSSRVGGTRAPPGASANAMRGGWVEFFRANEVEMVEIYPEGTENSRTLCGRFPPSSGCSCPPEPAGLVIWLRQ